MRKKRIDKRELKIEKRYSDEEERNFEKKAQKRVSFKIHFIIFILANLLIWIFWSFIFKGTELGGSSFKVSIFITLVWGIFVIAHYLFVYKWNKSYVEKETLRVKKEQEEKEKQLEELKEEQNQNQY